MKAFTLPYSNSVPFQVKEQAADQFRTDRADAKLKQQLTPAQYVIGVLSEGLKQNLLGADIDMEFLTLTVRSYASESVKAVRRFISKTGNKNISQTSI